MAHILFCDLSHCFCQIWRDPQSHLSTHFCSYFLDRQAVISALVNAASSSLSFCITAKTMYCAVLPTILFGREWSRIRGKKCFPLCCLPDAVYCTVAWQGRNLFRRGFINIGCGPCLPVCPSCLLIEMSAGCLACLLPVTQCLASSTAVRQD